MIAVLASLQLSVSPAAPGSPATSFCAQPAARLASPSQTLPSRGSLHALVLFGTFADDGTTGSTAPTYADSLFLEDLPGSLTHFFDEMSHGQYRLTGSTAPRIYRSRDVASDYLSSSTGFSGNFGRFVREIVDAAEEDIDFGAFDNDGPDGQPNSGDDDGFVDVLFVVLPDAPSGFLVSEADGIAALGLSTPLFTDDPSANGGRIRIRDDQKVGRAVGGSIQKARSFTSAVGIIAHELGHLLGLPDLFDTEFTNQGDLSPADDSAGIGYWGLMGHGARGWQDEGGPTPFTAWSLARLGWLGVGNENLEIVDQTQRGLRIVDSATDEGIVYRMALESPRYLLIEHRRSDGSYYERGLPQDGLLIWQIDEFTASNNIEQRKLVDLVCADGLYADAGFPLGVEASPAVGSDNLDFWAHDSDYRTRHRGNLGDATDVFDGERFTEYTPVTNPSSRNVAVEAIRTDGDVMIADLIVDDPRKAGVIARDEVWSGTIDVVADIEVPTGVRLRITSGTTVRFFPDARRGGVDPIRSEVSVNGVLSVGGGLTTTFTSAAESPAPADWSGIWVHPLGEILVIDTVIEYADHAIVVSNARRNPLIEDVLVRHIRGHAMQFDADEGAHTLTRVTVEDVQGTGMLLTGEAPVTVEGARITGCGGPGLHRDGGFLQCSGGDFSDNGRLDGAVNMLLEDAVFGTVEENQFRDGTGVFVDGAAEVRINDNVFRDTRVAIQHRNGRAWIQRNTITESDTAFQIEGVTEPVRFELNRVSDVRILVDNQTRRDVIAIRNWWGSVDAASIGTLMSGGPVIFEPFLNFDPLSPVTFDIGPVFPNPSVSDITIPYTIGIGDVSVSGGSGLTIVEIHNVVGGFVRRLVEQIAAPGIYSVQWDGLDQAGRPAAAGFYYAELDVGGILLYTPMIRFR